MAIERASLEDAPEIPRSRSKALRRSPRCRRSTGIAARSARYLKRSCRDREEGADVRLRRFAVGRERCERERTVAVWRAVMDRFFPGWDHVVADLPPRVKVIRP
jgi:hypothetical protein